MGPVQKKHGIVRAFVTVFAVRCPPVVTLAAIVDLMFSIVPAPKFTCPSVEKMVPRILMNAERAVIVKISPTTGHAAGRKHAIVPE